MRKLILISFLLIYATSFAGNYSEFKLRINGELPIDLPKLFTTTMPGKSIHINVEAVDVDRINITSNYGKLKFIGKGEWKYIAPENYGNYEIIVKDRTSNNTITIIVFVLTPASDKQGEYLNNYRIGYYPDEKYKGKKNYVKPTGFIEVTNENKDLFISPHFQLKQFLCKQTSGWPKYILLNPRLVIKLEHLVLALADLGKDVNTIFIMSGYRTPYYNKAIGNVKYSRHIYGDAADVYIDEDMDGVIDDLDENGKSEMEDAILLHELLSDLEEDPENEHLIGGIGKYKKNLAHTYFIHVDTRGYRARW